jgi:catechol 2,3-dioxygenase-like lactoylglutathione lyase family enzyme
MSSRWIERLTALVVLMAAIGGSLAVARAEPPGGSPRLGLYILSTDLARSSSFYTALFQTQAAIDTGIFLGFRLEGGLFAVASKSTYAPTARHGDMVVPYIMVRCIDGAYAHVAGLAGVRGLDKQITTDGPIRLFKFRDPDGNLIEYFSLQVAGQ